MSFRFSLETVLRFRESVEKREELALQQVQMQLAQARRAVDEATAEIRRARQAREECLREPVPAAHLQAMVRAAEAAAERRKVLEQAVHVLEQQRAQRLEAYQAAHRGRQMLSDIRTRQRDAHDLEHTRRQQKFLDDLFGARHQRS